MRLKNKSVGDSKKEKEAKNCKTNSYWTLDGDEKKIHKLTVSQNVK